MALDYKDLNNEYKIKKVIDIFKICKKFNTFKSDDVWIFRGESDYNWRLRTTFERAIIDYFIDKKKLKEDFNDSTNIEEKVQEALERKLLNWKSDKNSQEKNIIEFEKNLLRDYQRKSRNVMKYIPDQQNWVEWLATMQHYGAPTRLLDWNYSFFIALYFSVEKATSDCSIYMH